MIFLLQYLHNLSDKQVVRSSVENSHTKLQSKVDYIPKLLETRPKFALVLVLRKFEYDSCCVKNKYITKFKELWYDIEIFNLKKFSSQGNKILNHSFCSAFFKGNFQFIAIDICYFSITKFLVKNSFSRHSIINFCFGISS